MSQPHQKTFFQVGAVLLATGAAQMLLVDPAERSLSTARAALQSERARASQAIAPQLSPESLAKLQSRNAAMRNSIVGRSAIIKDESTLYATLMDLATASKVRIDQLQPVTISEPTQNVVPPPPGAPPAKPVPRADTHVGYSMNIVGSYGDIVAFVESVQAKAGYAVVRSIRMSPADQREVNAIQAIVQTEHFGFELKSPQASAGGTQ